MNWDGTLVDTTKKKKKKKEKEPEDPNEPVWLSEEYDIKHLEENIAPLFGTGSLSLIDPDTPTITITTSDVLAEITPSSPTTSNSLTDALLGSMMGSAGGGDGTYGSTAAATKNGKKGKGGDRGDDNHKSEKEEEDEEENVKPKRRSTQKINNRTFLHNKGDPDETDMEKERRAALAAALKPHMPRQKPCLWLFHLLQGCTAVTSTALLITQILPLFTTWSSSSSGSSSSLSSSEQQEQQLTGPLSLLLKLYVSLFCLLFALVETDMPIPLLLDSPILQNFISRGFVYSFLGLICVEESYSERVKDIISHRQEQFHVTWEAVFMQLSSWFMLAFGVVYMLLGMCCLKGIRDRQKQKEKEEWAQYRVDLKRWKELYQ